MVQVIGHVDRQCEQQKRQCLAVRVEVQRIVDAAVEHAVEHEVHRVQFGKHEALYAARRAVDSPFGLAVRGIHENRARMAALGTPVFARLLAMYMLAGALAGAAGALSAQTNAIVGMDSLSFALSAEVLVMLILGGAGRLTGALIGALVFTLLHHTAASINPYHWLFIVGAALMAVVLLPPQKAWGWLRARMGAKA